jgi:hypothetical protein
MNYTPAPWFIKTEDTINEVPALWTIRDRHHGVIATIESVNPDDAALIAAAPDLLAALMVFETAWNQNRLFTSDEAAIMRAAIAKIPSL